MCRRSVFSVVVFIEERGDLPIQMNKLQCWVDRVVFYILGYIPIIARYLLKRPFQPCEIWKIGRYVQPCHIDLCLLRLFFTAAA